MSRKLTEAIKKKVAAKQHFRCANKPNSNLVGIEDYQCPLWKNNGDGVFDESGYNIDHINEHSLTQNDNIKNLQALCLMCHGLKTNNFVMSDLCPRRNSKTVI